MKRPGGGLRKFKTALARIIAHRKQTVDWDNEGVLFSLAKAGAGLTESQISDALSSMSDVERITEADVIRVLEIQKRAHYPSQKFPSLGLYQAFFQTGGYKGLLDLAKRMGYSRIVVDVSFPDGFQNYLLYRRLGFEPAFVSEDQKEYFHKAMRLFDESRKSGKSLSDSVWDLTTHLSHQMIPMSLDLGNQDAVAMYVSEQVRSSLAGISSVAKELRASRSINYVENYQINAIAQQFRQSFTGEFFSRKQSYIVSWVHRFAVFLSDLNGTGPTVENISRLDGFIRRGNIISRIPDEYFRIFSEQQMTDILKALVGYLELDDERSALIERLREITGKDQLFVEKLIATSLFIQDEIRRKVTYQSVTQDERVFNVVGKRAGGGTLDEFTRLPGMHTFTPQEYKSFMFRFMMPEDLYHAIKNADGRARIALHVGKPNDSYIQDLLGKGFVLHSFRKSEKEKQYRNRSLYYRIGADGTVEIEFINVVDFGNLRHLIDFYLTVVDSVSVVDHMPDYEQMLLSLLKRKPFDFPINMVGVGAGYAMGTFAPEQFESFYDSFNDPQAAEEDQSPYLFRMMRDLPEGRALAGFNITLGELDTYSARLLLEQFPDAKAFISAGAIGLIGDQQYSYSDPNAVLPGDIFVPTTISDNFSDERINNRYADELVATLEENKISYQLIDMQGKKQKLLKEHSFDQGDHPVKVVLGKLFTVDSLAVETLDAIKKLRDADVRAVDMEASLVLKTVRSMRPDMDLYFGYQITDVPGAINLDSQDVNNDVQALIRQKRSLAVKVFSLTAHRILRQKDAEIKDAAQRVDLDPAMLKKGGIDLTRENVRFQVQRAGNDSQVNFDPAMIEQLRNAAGLTPAIIDIRLMTTSVQTFLSIKAPAEELSMR